jgi:hypothetical protein
LQTDYFSGKRIRLPGQHPGGDNKKDAAAAPRLRLVCFVRFPWPFQAERDSSAAAQSGFDSKKEGKSRAMVIHGALW